MGLRLLSLREEALQVGAHVGIANFTLHIPVPLVDLALLQVETLGQLRNQVLAPIGCLVELVLQDLMLVLVLAAALGLSICADLWEVGRQEFRGPLRLKIFSQTQQRSEPSINGSCALAYTGERTHLPVIGTTVGVGTTLRVLIDVREVLVWAANGIPLGFLIDVCILEV